MKRKLLYLLFTLFTLNLSAQTISIIGDAVAGWTTDVNMSTVDGITYTLNGFPFLDGQAKFRQDNSWDVNWGASFFPVGTATQGGDNIPITAGTYNVTFNKNTGAYSFSTAANPTINMIGDAVAGWNTDVPMSTLDGVTYILNDYTFVTGQAKFRQGNTWDINWGSMYFPTGTGTQDGQNIQITGGTYDVTFNRNTGVYTFTNPAYPIISMVGDALTGWGTDVIMNTVDGINYTLNTYTFSAGLAKFRQDGAWSVNWGASDFPAGVALANGSDIPIPAGTYNVTFNRTTGVYSFSYVTIGLIGSATAGNWFSDTIMNTTDGIVFTLNNVSLTTGEVKFRQNGTWNTNWGSNDTTNSFPSGVAVFNAATNIAITADNIYDVTFNRNTLEYSFNQSLGTQQFDLTHLIVYPNPTQNGWTFTAPNETISSIAVYDVTGKRLIMHNSNEITVSIDASSLSKGIYFAKIFKSNGTETIKLIKE